MAKFKTPYAHSSSHIRREMPESFYFSLQNSRCQNSSNNCVKPIIQLSVTICASCIHCLSDRKEQNEQTIDGKGETSETSFVVMRYAFLQCES